MTLLRQLYLVALLSFCASGARADAWHFSLESGLLSWNRSSTELPYLDGDTKQLGIGFPSILGARVGYLPLDVLEVGLRGSVYWTKFNAGSSGDAKSTSGETLVYARYVLPGKTLRLFAGPTLGLAFQRARYDGEFGSLTRRALVVGGELGLYGFVRDAISIDPFLSFAYSRGTSESPSDPSAGFGGTVDYDVTGLQLVLGVAVSGWLFR